MTYEMKRELRDKIDNLPEKKIRTVLAIIQESMPDLGNNGQEEIELEVDSLDTNTLLRLYNYAVLNRKEGSENNTPAPVDDSELTANGKKKKSKPLSEEEHNRKIAEIRSKIQEFDQASGKPIDSSTASSAQQMVADAGPSAAATTAVESDSSDDEQMDSDSSSEEE
ncbi:hypothetical protein FF38_02063 [Lucilia cuprina]|uniref:NET domain-containing protein n=1 Tax=Lucilia cuprina TaxID=7375 RepID=A0A0L0CDC4_LUCCU|nr:hypothetical protein FF38_02063 [Lucilia cuprina]